MVELPMVVGNQRIHELDSCYLDIYIINKTWSHQNQVQGYK